MVGIRKSELVDPVEGTDGLRGGFAVAAEPRVGVVEDVEPVQDSPHASFARTSFVRSVSFRNPSRVTRAIR